MGDAFVRELIRRRLLPDVSSQLLCLSKCASKCDLEGAARCLPSPFHHIFSFKFSDTADVKYTNTRLSHLIRYNYNYISNDIGVNRPFLNLSRK